METTYLFQKFFSLIDNPKYFYGSRRYGFRCLKIKNITVDHKIDKAKNIYEIEGPGFIAGITSSYTTDKIIDFWVDGEQNLKSYLTMCLLSVEY